MMIPESELPEEIKEERRRRKEISEKFAAQWSTPITFYGRVVDEKGNGVEGAEVKIIISDTSQEGTTHYQLKSDSMGLFALGDVRGKGLSVYVEHPGYLTSKQSRRNFEYAGGTSPFVPNPRSPEIFRLQRKGEAVPLVKNERLWGVPPDGQIYSVDLLRGKVERASHNRGFGIQFERTEPNGGGEFSWKLTFHSEPGGGFIRTEDEFTMVAPASGYQPKIEVEGRGTSAVETPLTLLYRSPDGNQHARLDMRIIPKYSQNGAIDIRYVVNPDGGNSLYSEPGKAIKVTTHRDGSISLIYPKGYEAKTP
jgi:hypothetical protein